MAKDIQPVEVTGSSVPDVQKIPVKLLSAAGAEPLIGRMANQDANTGNVDLIGAVSYKAQYNGATWDRERGNTEGALLASAARTALISSPNQINYNAKGVIVYLNITVASGTGGLTFRIEGIDPISGNLVVLAKSGTAITATGLYAIELYPGATGAGTAGASEVNTYTSGALPRTWRVRVTPGDATSYTYSVGHALIN